MINLIKWMAQIVTDSQTGKPSVKRYGMALSFTVLCGIMFGLGCVIAYAVVHSSGRDQVDITRLASETIQWIAAIVVPCAAGTYAYDRKITKGNPNEPAN